MTHTRMEISGVKMHMRIRKPEGKCHEKSHVRMCRLANSAFRLIGDHSPCRVSDTVIRPLLRAAASAF
ncbi:uncharacterized protein SEPMUDRAFT_146426 [Sphaerulina musiva SO2202]|uniref:Uncharacterized protein n=1 Tax=Sphaerulina musiva (strain SO2202) TaxID=692275 RepID=N1QM73_SPHMS|nr:uncharacterized protein SEPMUDRAFT_146426 [Sphaerulina musiva SO2202]EMF17387.1 hypothetical protein SEPMUDRAFT_146426 [Sphaerulina musiva SO2202]